VPRNFQQYAEVPSGIRNLSLHNRNHGRSLREGLELEDQFDQGTRFKTRHTRKWPLLAKSLWILSLRFLSKVERLRRSAS